MSIANFSSWLSSLTQTTAQLGRFASAWFSGGPASAKALHHLPAAAAAAAASVAGSAASAACSDAPASVACSGAAVGTGVSGVSGVSVAASGLPSLASFRPAASCAASRPGTVRRPRPSPSSFSPVVRIQLCVVTPLRLGLRYSSTTSLSAMDEAVKASLDPSAVIQSSSSRQSSRSSKPNRSFKAIWSSIRSGLYYTAAGLSILLGGSLVYTAIHTSYYSIDPRPLFQISFHDVQQVAELRRRLGNPIKAYGIPSHQRFMHSKTYKKNGVRMSQITYPIFGPRGTANVYVEMIEDSESGQLVYNYLIVQFARGEALYVIDKRLADAGPPPSQITPSSV